MTHRIYLVLLFLLSLPLVTKAQLGKELILNGGFEDYAAVTPPSPEKVMRRKKKEGLTISTLIKSRFIGTSTLRCLIPERRKLTVAYSL